MARKYKFMEIRANSMEERLLKNVNKTLIENFNKVAAWVQENCPHLNGRFECHHNPYYWIALVVEDGKAYLESGNHSSLQFARALSTTETAEFSVGSMQSIPYAYREQFASNKTLEEFLGQWEYIKAQVVAKNNTQQSIYSQNFTA